MIFCACGKEIRSACAIAKPFSRGSSFVIDIAISEVVVLAELVPKSMFPMLVSFVLLNVIPSTSTLLVGFSAPLAVMLLILVILFFFTFVFSFSCSFSFSFSFSFVFVFDKESIRFIISSSFSLSLTFSISLSFSLLFLFSLSFSLSFSLFSGLLF